MEATRNSDLSRTKARTSSIVRLLMKVLVLSVVMCAAVALALYSRTPPTHVGDSYDDDLPFRPRVIYSGSSVAVVNTETKPYYDVQLTLFVDRSTCRANLGTIDAGTLARVPLGQFKFDDGTGFDSISSTARLLEVRARFEGREVHRDLPPPTVK
jgi:hypothetical protein